MKGFFKVRNVISYVLLLAMMFSIIPIGNIRAVYADDVSNDRTFVKEVNIKTNLTDGLIVDKRNDGVLVCENISLGTDSFIISSKDASKYKIVSVSSNGSMSSSQGGSTDDPIFTFSGIKNYNDFKFTIKVKEVTDDGNGAEKTYIVLMRFDVESLLQFDNIRITYTDSLNSVSTALIGYNTLDTDGYYRNNVEDNVETAKVELLDGNAVMSMGVTVKSENGQSGNTVNLLGGDNIITITVSRNNVSREYGLIIYKKGQALLTSIVPSAGSLEPKFDTNSFNYEVTVPTTQETISFTPTSIDNSSTIRVNGRFVKSGKKSSEIKLSEGSNKISIDVTTKEGKSASYIIRVIRTEKFRSSNLSALKLSSGKVSPSFNKETYEYSAVVDNKVSSIYITPVAEDKESTIKVNGKKVASGANSNFINLDEGSNSITVSVRDEKGHSSNYIINVTRKYPKDNAKLETLELTEGTITPKFDSENYLYSVKVARNIEKIRAKFTSQNENCKIKVYKNGETTTKEYISSQQSDFINLEIGANLVIVEVFGEDKKSSTKYKLSIIRDKIEGVNQWVLVAGQWTFYNGYGIQAKNQWVKYDNQWYFLDINGYLKTGWIFESGNWYYLNESGIMQTGWFYEKGYWYYLQANGILKKNSWSMYDGNWYFFNDLGEIQTGWTLYKGRWYYLDEHGVMQKGWVTYDKNKFYLNDDGTMRTGWLFSGKVWYYLGYSGDMKTGWQTINGKRYYFDSAGVMKTGMIFLDGKWINLGVL